MWKRAVSLSLVLGGLFSAFPALAADTTEAFAVGATDFEFYFGVEGLGLKKYEKTLTGEAVLGYGLTESLSGYVAISGEANERLGGGGGSAGFGLYGTPLDSDHVDLDLFLHAAASPDSFSLTPALELNFDLAPDLESWGVYVRVEEELSGRDESRVDDAATAADESKTKFAFAPMTALTLGTYWSIGAKHQLLLEYDMAVANNPAKGEDRVDIGGVALGYNVLLSDSIEMINQVYLDIPQNGQKVNVGLSTGIIVTLPEVGAGNK